MEWTHMYPYVPTHSHDRYSILMGVYHCNAAICFANATRAFELKLQSSLNPSPRFYFWLEKKLVHISIFHHDIV